MRWIKILFLQSTIIFILFITLDFIYSFYVRQSFIIPDFLGGNERILRIENTIFHNTFAPSIDIQLKWGSKNYRTCTDPSGFKSKCINLNNMRTHFDVAFIGDSFTEAIGMPYEKSFVGIFDQSNPTLKVANFAVSSYSPSIYLRKIKWLLENDYYFKHLYVFVDISDYEEENVTYINDIYGNVIPKNSHKLLPQNLKIFIRENFYLSIFLYEQLRFKLLGSLPSNFIDEGFSVLNKKNSTLPTTVLSSIDNNSATTVYSQDNKYIEKAITKMIKLHELLNSSGINLSIAIYPTGHQLKKSETNKIIFDTHRKIWNEFCKNRCKNFIDIFPTFSKLIKNHGIKKIHEKYFLIGDKHFNFIGNKVVFDVIDQSKNY